MAQKRRGGPQTRWTRSNIISTSAARAADKGLRDAYRNARALAAALKHSSIFPPVDGLATVDGGHLAAVEVNVTNSVSSNNGVGIQNSAGATTIRLSNNDISFNGRRSSAQRNPSPTTGSPATPRRAPPRPRSGSPPTPRASSNATTARLGSFLASLVENPAAEPASMT
jgi:hypothetical protein